jgi:acetyltransferase-like isoleucine patch superfamily enzyme
MLLYRIFKRFFYSPVRHAKRLAFVYMSKSAVLMQGARFTFFLGERRFKGRVEIGSETVLGAEFIFESDQGEIKIGDRTFINCDTKLISRTSIEIGSDVTIAWGCTIYNHNSHSINWVHRGADIQTQLANIKLGKNLVDGKNWTTVKSRPIIISDKVWIGFGCTILSGVTIGEGAIIGACSVVREDVAPWTVVAGNPAILMKNITR